MSTGAMIGLFAAIVAAGTGIFFALYALGFFQYLGGQKQNPNAVSKAILVRKLTNLNDPAKPYRIIPGDSADTDLIAEWKIADASWYGLFNKSGLKKIYRAFLLLDEARHTVRCFEILGTVSWSAGTAGLTPLVHYSRSRFGGRILFQKSYGAGYGIKDLKSMETGKVYGYRFDIAEIRDPIEATVKENGWEWVPVTAKRHVLLKASSSASVQAERKDRTCVQCGARLRQRARFCTVCGAAAALTERSSGGDEARKRSFAPWVLAGIGLVFLTVLFALLPDADQKKHAVVITDAAQFNQQGMEKVKEGKIKEAASLFEKAVKADPDNFHAWNNLGLALRKTGKKKDAIKAYRHAIEVKPDFALAYKNLGILLEEMNNSQEASRAYLKYYELNPTAPDAQTVKETADKLMSTQPGVKR